MDPFENLRQRQRRSKGKRARNAKFPIEAADDSDHDRRDEDEASEPPEFSWGLSSDDNGTGCTDGRTAMERLADRVMEKTGSPVFRLESGGVLTVPRLRTVSFEGGANGTGEAETRGAMPTDEFATFPRCLIRLHRANVSFIDSG